MASATTTRRAKKGGEVSPINGKFYKGGQFMPTTGTGKKPAKSKRKGTGKKEVKPYVWEKCPEYLGSGYTPILEKIEAFTNYNGELVQEAVDFYEPDTKKLKKLNDLITMYNCGCKWFKEDEENDKYYYA